MKYAFMEKHRDQFTVEKMSEVLEVSRSGYRDWRRGKRPAAIARQKLLRAIEDIHRSSQRSYGSPRIYRQLRALGYQCSKSTIERLMRANGIRSKVKRKFKATTDSNHALPVAENIVNRNFNPPAPNRIWLSDITYIRTHEGWLYLAVILDAYSRRVVGWSMNARMTQQLVIDALEMAVARRKPGRGLILHSDRGSQYASTAYQRRLWRHGIICSMSRKGNCWDNAPMESFFHTLKMEHVFHEEFKTRSEAQQSIFAWIEIFYNRFRTHSSIGYCAPEYYEQTAAAICA
jgi:transposase InsO family protein